MSFKRVVIFILLPESVAIFKECTSTRKTNCGYIYLSLRMTLQSEVCLWTLLGLVRTIFDATLFKVNANLKQVWQMKMPPEISLPVQRVIRTMISGLMLAQCFTVYVYLASYIVLLYPVFLEERPTLVLPWLLLAAVRNLLCELMSLATGLGICVLLGPARPPCIRFVIMKLASILPSFYMWMLIFGYYHNLKMASAFKTFPAVLPAKDLDYGLELAVRRRRTKSLQGEDQLRKKLIASLYSEQTTLSDKIATSPLTSILESQKITPIASNIDITSTLDVLYPLSVTGPIPDIGMDDDWVGSEVMVPRDTDRILEQFVLMLLRIGAYMKKEKVEPTAMSSNSEAVGLRQKRIDCTAMHSEDAETPHFVGNSKRRMASYLRDYPQIFGKKPDVLRTLNTLENEIPMIRSNLSCVCTNPTKEVSTNTTSLEFKDNLLTQEPRDMPTNSQKVISDSHLKDISEERENKQIPNNLKMNSVTSLKSDSEIVNARAEPMNSLGKLKTKSSEPKGILNLNLNKRKSSKLSSENEDIDNSERSNKNNPKYSKSNKRYQKK